MAFINGGRGGEGSNSTNLGYDEDHWAYYGIRFGGFGGGGGNAHYEGAGGGGYNGGNADQDPGQNGGDGGGSRNNGTNQTNTAGTNNGHGKVIITKL